MKVKISILTLILLIFTSVAIAHPTGNLIVVDDTVLWSYINPIDDPEHRACVMIWNKNSEPKVFIQSKYAASDFMLYNNSDNEIYIIERRFIPNTLDFEVRVLKTTIGNNPNVIWDWFKDDHRIGEGGFYMLSDEEIVFGRYPNIYQMKKGEKPKQHFKFKSPVTKIRKIDSDKILLIGENSCWLTDLKGVINKEWNNLIDSQIDNAPLNRNQIFDADFRKGELLLAYWGNRSFELINKNGVRKTLLQNKTPYVSHWVSFYGNEKLLFSSKLLFNGETPKPNLTLLNTDKTRSNIWIP